MRKLRAAALVAVFASVGFLGAGAAHADQAWGEGRAGGLSIRQNSICQSHDSNVDLHGEVGIAGGLGGSLLNGEGNPGAHQTSLGSTTGCNDRVGD